MAAQYGDHFGWRINSEGQRQTEGTLKSPKGAALAQGTVVERDLANPGYLKVAEDASGQVGQVGLLQQDDAVAVRSMFAGGEVETSTFGTCKADHRSVMVSGAGMAFWVENTPARTKLGRSFAAVTKWAGLTAVGDMVGWDGTTFIKVTDPAVALGTVRRFETANRVVVTLNK